MIPHVRFNDLSSRPSNLHDSKVAPGLQEQFGRPPQAASRIGLVGRHSKLIANVKQSCSPSFEVHVYDPSEVVRTLALAITRRQGVDAAHAFARDISSLGAVLIEWVTDAEARIAAQLLETYEQTYAAYRAAPIVALCPSSMRAESIAALATSADFIAHLPVQVGQVQAIQASYRRRTAEDVHLQERTARKQENKKEDIESEDEAHGRGPTPSSEEAEGRSGVGDGQVSSPSQIALAPPEEDGLCVGPLQLNPQTQKLWIAGTFLSLTQRPFELLLYLAERSEQCCTREELLESVWDLDFDPTTNLVDVQIYELRMILSEYDLEGMIQTVRGRGYRLRWPIPNAD